jgi:ABC-type thiamin/hydroxymethylpyrimidine transport system permease subunit
MRFTVRELVYIGVFGALWAAVETTLGSALHVLNTPFAGVVLTGIGITVALVGRLFVPRRGSVFFIGAVTALLKMLSLGGIVINPMIAILAESLAAELVLLPFGSPRRMGFVFAGGAATLWCLVHPFLTQGVLAGRGVLAIYQQILERGAGLLGFDGTAVVRILIALVAVYFLTGAVCGFAAWDLGRIVDRRLRTSLRYAEAD